MIDRLRPFAYGFGTVGVRDARMTLLSTPDEDSIKPMPATPQPQRLRLAPPTTQSATTVIETSPLANGGSRSIAARQRVSRSIVETPMSPPRVAAGVADGTHPRGRDVLTSGDDPCRDRPRHPMEHHRRRLTQALLPGGPHPVPRRGVAETCGRGWRHPARQPCQVPRRADHRPPAASRTRRARNGGSATARGWRANVRTNRTWPAR